MIRDHIGWSFERKIHAFEYISNGFIALMTLPGCVACSQTFFDVTRHALFRLRAFIKCSYE